jgi:hypothetical protein
VYGEVCAGGACGEVCAGGVCGEVCVQEVCVGRCVGKCWDRNMQKTEKQVDKGFVENDRS